SLADTARVKAPSEPREKPEPDLSLSEKRQDSHRSLPRWLLAPAAIEGADAATARTVGRGRGHFRLAGTRRDRGAGAASGERARRDGGGSLAGGGARRSGGPGARRQRGGCGSSDGVRAHRGGAGDVWAGRAHSHALREARWPRGG